MKQNKTMGYIAITIVSIIYGVSYLSRELITKTNALDATVITLMQLAIMAVLFLLYNLITRKSLKVSGKDIPMVVISGMFGTFLFHNLSNWSVSYVSGSIPSLLFGLAAVFSLLGNMIVYKKKTNGIGWFAVVVGLVGLAIIVGITPDNFANTRIEGYVLSVGSVLAWVIYCFLSDKVSNQYEKSVTLFWQAAVGVVASLPFLIVYPIDGAAVSANFSTIVINLVILGVFNATIAYFLNIYAIKQIGVSMANMFLNFMPIATLVAVFLVQGVPPTMNQVVGGLIIIISVFMLGYAEKRENTKANNVNE